LIIKELKKKTKELRELGYNIPQRVEKIQIESLKNAKKISKSIKELDDMNEKVAVAKAVASVLIEDLGLNFSGKMLMLTEILQTEIGLNILHEQNGGPKETGNDDDWPKNKSGPSYVS